ncbi:STAS domain-containing protein [Streptomyces pactum]|uniref:STAS domain-containing protein n=1 Tax=Streptomyces pactum TaxID=68249 RepID=UPI0036FCE412
MAVEHPASASDRPAVAVTAVGARRAELTLTGDISADHLRELEERLAAPPMSDATEWAVDLRAVTHMDLACGYALLRAVSRRPDPVALTVHGARRPVRRTLRDIGFDALAVFEE